MHARIECDSKVLAGPDLDLTSFCQFDEEIDGAKSEHNRPDRECVVEYSNTFP